MTEKRRLVAIAALGENRVIGRGSAIPWHLPEDFRHFKRTTMGGALVMGRATFESVGKPLPGRETIVMSRTKAEIPGATVVSNWDDVWPLFPEKPLWLAGGGQLYASALPLCDELLLSHVHQSPQGDVFFPAYDALFDEGEIVSEHEGFTVRKHRRRPIF